MNHSFDRREFLRRASVLIPAMHAAGFAGSASASVLSPAEERPVEFLQLRLRTSRLNEQREFYRTKLGLPLAGETSDSVTLRAGKTELQFVDDDSGSNPYYHFAFNIPENKLDAAIAWMDGRAPLVQRRGTNGPVFHFAHWNAHAIYFFDPAGNIVEFIARHTLANAAQGSFDTRDILYASEIGLVVPAVPAAVLELQNKLGIREYLGVSEAFAPVGNEHALFIVVKTGRTWFGTESLAATVFPAEVTLRGSASAEYSLPAGSMRIHVRN